MTLMDRYEEIARWLRLFVVGGQVTELRALHLAGGHKIVSEFFAGRQLAEMAARAVELEESGARGVYFTPNPLRSDMAVSRRASTDRDVVARHWLLIDVDPVRDPDNVDDKGKPLADQKVSTTDEERAAAWEVLLAARAELEEKGGFVGPVVGDSGNGWHVCYPLSLPNDTWSKNQVRQILHGLQTRCGNGAALVDTATFNASRIWKLYGTLSRKGEPTSNRPWRYSRIID